MAELLAEMLASNEPEDGLPSDSLLAELHSSGLGFLDVVKAIRQHWRIDLHEAYEIVVRHPAWAVEAERSQGFQDILLEALMTPLAPGDGEFGSAVASRAVEHRVKKG